MQNQTGHFDKVGDGNGQDQGYSFDLGYSIADNCNAEYLVPFYSLGPEGLPVRCSASYLNYGFNNLSESVLNSDSLNPFASEPISSTGMECNSSEMKNFDQFLSYEPPGAWSSNAGPIDPLDQPKASMTDTQVVDVIYQGYGIDPSLLIRDPSTPNNRNSQMCGLGSYEEFVSSEPMDWSVAQEHFNSPFELMQFFPPSTSISNGSCSQHERTSTHHELFVTESTVKGREASGFDKGDQLSLNYSILQDSNMITGPGSLLFNPEIPPNTGPPQSCGDYINSIQSLPHSIAPSGFSHALILPDNHQSCSSEQQILDAAPRIGTPSRQVFGPPRTIKNLPTPRKGGRRGPLSATQLHQRNTARKVGICIRCRRLRTKCSGGVPCVMCQKNTKAALWIYPCTRAQFSDIVESEPVFSLWDPLEAEFIEAKTLNSQQRNGSRNHYLVKRSENINMEIKSRSTVQLSLIAPALRALSGDSTSTKCNLSMITRPNKENTSGLIDRFILTEEMHMQEAIYLLFLEYNDYTSYSTFCVHRASSPNLTSAEVNYKAVQLILGLASRHAEIFGFRSLQRRIDHPDSSEADRIKTIYLLLSLGYILLYNLTKVTYLCHSDHRSSHRETSKTVLEGRKHVCSALFVHASIMIDKLPVGYDFWSKCDIFGREDMTRFLQRISDL